MTQLYDIIGDIHGHADALVALLTKMRYERRNGAWRHAERMAIFLGDFVDVGPKQVETVMIAKGMVEAGSALAVMGNHELNAIAWYLPDPAVPGDYLRSHFSEKWGRKNWLQHRAFLIEVQNDCQLHREIIDWFLTLPLWLDLPGLRIVHACWHSRFMEYLTPLLLPGARLNSELMAAATLEPSSVEEKDSPTVSVFKAVEAVTKGIEVPLPAGYTFKDKSGFERDRVRVAWWNEKATTYSGAAFLNDDLRKTLPQLAIPETFRGLFHGTDKPTFIGHYWLTGSPQRLTEKFACVDYSVAKGGPLCAYRWDGESVLDDVHFCWV